MCETFTFYTRGFSKLQCTNALAYFCGKLIYAFLYNCTSVCVLTWTVFGQIVTLFSLNMHYEIQKVPSIKIAPIHIHMYTTD